MTNPAEDRVARWKRAEALQDAGEYDAAIALYTELIRERPHSVLYRGRGQTFSGHGDFDNAIADFTKAVELDPLDTEAYTDRGHAYLFKQEWEAAKRDYDKVIDLLSPTLSSAFAGRGRAAEKLGSTVEHLRDLELAARLDPANPWVRTNTSD